MLFYKSITFQTSVDKNCYPDISDLWYSRCDRHWQTCDERLTSQKKALSSFFS